MNVNHANNLVPYEDPRLNEHPLPSDSSTSSSSFSFILVTLGIALSIYAMTYAWNRLKERKITPAPSPKPLPITLHSQTNPTTSVTPDSSSNATPLSIKLSDSRDAAIKREAALKRAAASTPSKPPIPPSSSRSIPFVSSPARNSTHAREDALKREAAKAAAAFQPVTYEMIEKFYLNQETDTQERTLLQLQNMNFYEKEFEHDYIQWMFPTDEKSMFVQNAPLFSIEQFRTLSQKPAILTNVKLSFSKILEFYGLHYQEESSTVEKNPNFVERAKNWLTYNNHNHLRISRILRCLMLFGLEKEATAFYQFLSNLYPSPDVSERTAYFWKHAIRPIEQIPSEPS